MFLYECSYEEEIVGAAQTLNYKRQERKLLQFCNDTGMNTGVFQNALYQLRTR
jgi:hypothetical protein